MHSIARYIFFLVVTFSLMGQLTSYGQNINPQNLTNIVPPTPEAAAFAKYIDMPVGYSTGTAQVNIPLYTVTSGALSVPISLTYNTSGIKVEEAATWVGLGWNLNTGGNLTRIVRGLPDDYDTSGYMHTATTVQYLRNIPYTSIEFANQLNIRAYNSQALDVEPDIYIYSVMGHSGKFYFDQQSHQFVQTPNQAVKIQYVLDGSKIKGWTLTLPEGISCYFGLSKDGNRTGYDIFNNQSGFSVSNGSNVDPPGGGGLPSHITGWQLMDIAEPTGYSVKYFYTSYASADFGRGGETEDYNVGGVCETFPERPTASFYKEYSSKSYINRISTELGDIFFIPSASDRQDVLAEPAATKALDSIVIKNKSQQIIKSFSFDYGYFVSTDITAINGMGDVTDVSAKRLFLRSVTENSVAGDVKLPYKFYYDTTFILPNRLSAAQDFWGYYNHKNNGSFLTPKLSVQSIYSFGSGYTAGADRSVDFNYAKACALNKVQYATGGTTEYFFEKNTVGNGYNTLMNGYQLPDVNDKFFALAKNSTYLSPTEPSTYQDTLVIGPISGSVNISSDITGCNSGGAQTDDCHVLFYLIGITDNSIYQTFQANTFTMNLSQGKYLVKAAVQESDPDNAPVNFSLTITWQENPSLVNYTTGGMRVYKIVSSDGKGGTLVKRLSYQLFSDTAKSSGELINVPVYKTKIYCGNTVEDFPNAVRVFSNSVVPLASLDGQILHYSNVTEYYSEGSSYKTEYEFSSDDYGTVDPGGTNYPPPTNVQRDWRRDLLLNKRTYEIVADPPGYRMLQSENHNYVPFESLDNGLPFGIKTASYISGVGFGYTFYNFTTEWFLQDSVVTSEHTYLANGNPGPVLNSYTKSEYNPYNYYMLSNSRMLNSKGEKIEKKVWYAADFNDIDGSSISSLKQGYFVDLPIKQQTSKDSKLIDGQVMLYNNQGLPINVYKYENASVVDTSAHDKNTLVPSNYVLKQSVGYTGDFYRAKEANSSNSPHVSYIWDYKSSYPVAKITNADSSDVAFCSFEADGSGGWTIGSGSTDATTAITGRSSYNLNGSIKKSGLNSSVTYLVSYWAQNNSPFSVAGTISGYPAKGKTILFDNSSWTLYVHKVTGQTTISINGSGHIDELRLYPATSQMTTYTYDPLIGMTSQTDPGNRITYYEYDGLARLKRIRDQDYNILKTYEYQYQVQGGCGGNCSIIALQTLAGTGTLGYPVGVFNVHGNLLGNASSPDQYVSLWNNDTADAALGTLAKGGDNLHFNIALNAGKTPPAGVTGCRYYQYDLAWNFFDGIVPGNGRYIDFGDGIGMHLPENDQQTPDVLPPNTTKDGYFDQWDQIWWYMHSYPDTSVKTITVYHNDAQEYTGFDNAHSPATSLTKLRNFRGNMPQSMQSLATSCYQQASALSVKDISNWASIGSIRYFVLKPGDGFTPNEQVSYAQDFMQNNRGLLQIATTRGGYFISGCRDSTFKLSRLKTGWTTYFNQLQDIEISDEQWDREDLSVLAHLTVFLLVAGNQHHSNDPANNPVIPIPSNVVDNVYIQIAAGSGQINSNGIINVLTGGTGRTSNSNAAVAFLKSKGWQVYVDSNLQ